jgi:hypothetical protein
MMTIATIILKALKALGRHHIVILKEFYGILPIILILKPYSLIFMPRNARVRRRQFS